jgi:spoIIIJ-associated protein
MSDSIYEFSAKTVEDAIEEGLQTLGLQRDAVTIDIVNSGSRGILGFGSEPAVVRLSPLEIAADAETSTESLDEIVDTLLEEATPNVTAAEEVDLAGATEAAIATEVVDDASDIVDADEDDDAGEEEWEALTVDLLSELLDLMGFDVEVVAEWRTAVEDDDEPYLNLDIQGDELGVLIGRRGETLSNLQFLLRLMVNQRLKTWKNIVVDVEQYKQRRIEQLTQLANRMAEQVASSGRPVSLEPMPANERRVIHIALRENPAVYTESTGEGERRKVTILPS